MTKWIVLAVLFLSACSDAPPLPQPPLRPGTLAGSANWTSPLGIQGHCGGPGLSSPFACDVPPGAVWGTSPGPGEGGVGCADPEPNICFSLAGGLLNYVAKPIGMAIVHIGTLSNTVPISIEAVVTATLDCSQVSYVGPVIYDGEGSAADPSGNYRSLYLSCSGGQVQAWLYGPTYAGPISTAAYTQGSTHALRIDWIPENSFTYFVDSVPILTETLNSLSKDSMSFTQPPHPALWFGSGTGSIGRFDWCTGY